MLFCDFKPDNVIQTEGSLKLIDLGAVYRVDDTESPIYGTPGFQAPEIADTGPTVPSDLFTIGRTLAVLCTAFRGYQSTYEFTLPPADEMPVYAQYDSLYQLLARATAPHPDDRFQTAEEMEHQLFGVLREVVASQTGTGSAAPSTLFTSELRGTLDAPDWTALPALLVASDDPGCRVPRGGRRHHRHRRARGAARPGAGAHRRGEATRGPCRDRRRALPRRGPRARRRRSRATRGTGASPGTEASASSRQVSPAAALDAFHSVYCTIPGELAPKLALGFAAECNGQFEVAARWYDIVSRTDPGFTTAAFGLARCRLAGGDRAGAIEAFNRVPDASIASVDAQVAKAETLLDSDAEAPVLDDVVAAGTVVAQLPQRSEARARLTAEVFRAALDVVRANGIDRIAPHRARPSTRRNPTSASASRRRTAPWPGRRPNGAERIALVDRANHVRPRTLT